MTLLEDKVVLVTGGGRGVGLAAARLCGGLGARVVVNDLGCDVEGDGRDDDIAEAAAQAITEAGGEALADVRDITEPGAAQALVALAIEHFGRLDAVISAAGITRHRRLVRVSQADLARALDVGATAQFSLLQAAAAHFVQAKQPGSIVLTTGQVGFFGQAREVPRAMAAAAVAGLTRSAAVELRKHGIRVNAVAPTARTRQTEDQPLFQGIGAASMTADHVAPLYAFLVSELANSIHGELLGIAGGRIYALQQRETTGAFTEAEAFAPDEILGVWDDITRS